MSAAAMAGPQPDPRETKTHQEDAVSEAARGRRGRSVAWLDVFVAFGGVVVLMGVLTCAALAQATKVDFSYTPGAPTAGEQVTFTSTSSLARPIVRESWDLNGDGRFDASGHAVMFTFKSPGIYSVTLQVQTDRGRLRSTSKLVTVLGAAPPPPPPPPPVPPTSAPTPPPAPAPLPPPTSGSTTGAPAAPTTITPFPVVRIAGLYSRGGVRLRLFTVTAPTGVSITVRCRGRGCPYRKHGPIVVRTSVQHPAGSARHVAIGRFRGRLLKPGVRLEVFVAHARQIGKYTRFTIRRGRPPLRADRCLRPGGTVFSCR
jgi:PKD domain